jgi:hypothetical protein
MNCEIATEVYSQPDPLSKIRELFPIAWKFLQDESNDFATLQTNTFDMQMHLIENPRSYHYLSNHRTNESELSYQLQELIGDMTSKLLLEEHFSKLIRKPIHFGLLCCDGHISTDRELTVSEALKMQKAAITIR